MPYENLEEAWKADQFAGLRERLKAMRDDSSVKSEIEALAKCQKSLAAGESLAEKFEAQALAKNEESSLLSEADTIKESKSRLAKARSAQTVLVAEAAMRTADEEANASQVRHASAKEALASARAAFSLAEEALKADNCRMIFPALPSACSLISALIRSTALKKRAFLPLLISVVPKAMAI